MKINVSKKQVSEAFDTVLKVNYCHLNFLLRFEKAKLCTISPSVGLLCDYYIFGDIVVSTGYSPTGELVNEDLIKKYEGLAKTVKTKEDMKPLIKSFLNEAVNNN